MADWAYALSQGLAAGAKTGSEQIGNQMRIDQAAEAERRAADLKLATAERLIAIDEAMKARAAERFAVIARPEMAGTAPVAPATVEETGITRAAAAEAGLKFGGFEADAATISELVSKAKTTLADPTATDEQREMATLMLEQLDKQSQAQSKLNAKDAEGKTRPRTFIEGARAAEEKAMLAGVAVPSAWSDAVNSRQKTDIEERKLELKERTTREETERKERSDVRRHEESMKRVESLIKRTEEGTKADGKSALRKNVELLQELKYTPEQIEKFIFDKKDVSEADLADRILARDKYGDKTFEQAVAEARAIKNATNATPAPVTPAGAGKVLTYDPTTRKFR